MKNGIFNLYLNPFISVTSQAKPYSWLPGWGMSIEVAVVGFDRPYIFAAILNRDEVYDSIIKHAIKANLAWALSSGKPDRKEEEEESFSSTRSSPSKGIKMSDIKDVNFE